MGMGFGDEEGAVMLCMLGVWRMSHGQYTGGGRAETFWKTTSAKEVGSAIELVNPSVVF